MSILINSDATAELNSILEARDITEKVVRVFFAGFG